MIRKLTKIGAYTLLATIWVTGVVITEGVTFTRIIGMGVTAIWAFYKISELVVLRRKLKFYKNNMFLFVLLILFLVIAGSSYFVTKDTSLWSLRIKTLIRLFFMVVIFYDQFRTKNDLITAWKVLIYSGIFISCLTVVNYFTGLYFVNIAEFSPIISYGTLRATGVFCDPNISALSMIVLFSFTYYLFKIRINKGEKIFLGIGLTVIIASILLTFSRGAMLTLIFVAILIIPRESKRHYLVGSFGILLFIAFYFLPFDQIFQRFNTVRIFYANLNNPLYLSHNFGSMWMRIVNIKTAWNTFLRNFLTGVGLGNYRLVMPYLSGYPFRKMVAHNMYLSIMAELGIFGISAFTAILIMVWKNLALAQNRFTDKNYQYLVKGLKIGFLGFLFGALFLDAQYYRILWVILAFSMISYRVSKEGAS